MGVAIYLLRVGWRLQLFRAAFRLGVELRVRLYARLSLQGPPFFHRQRTGDLMALATNDVDAVEMAAGEAFLAGLRRHADAGAGRGDDDARRRLAARPRCAAAVSVHGVGVLGASPRTCTSAWRRVARPLLQPQRARAGDRGRACARCARWDSNRAPPATSASARNARRTRASTRRNGRRPTSPRSASRSPWHPS